MDGDIEFIVCDVCGMVVVFKLNGVEFWNKYVEFWIVVVVSVGDVDGDDEIEIVVGDIFGVVYVFCVKDGIVCEYWLVYVGDKIFVLIVFMKFC